MQRLKARQRKHVSVESILRKLKLPEGISGRLEDVHTLAEVWELNWTEMPELTDPLLAARWVQRQKREQQEISEKSFQRWQSVPLTRFQRKQRQVEAFAALVRNWQRAGAEQGRTVVDFGCGSGNLMLPLAASFPELNFIGVDRSSKATGLLEHRAAVSGLSNVKAWCGRVEEYGMSSLDLDLALGLHVCGETSDRIVMLAVDRKKTWAIAPCCIGKIKLGCVADRIILGAGEQYTVEKKSDGTTWMYLRQEHILISDAEHVTIRDGGIKPPSANLPRPNPGEGPLAPSVVHFLQTGSGRADFTERADVVLTRANPPRLHYPRSKWLSKQISEDEFKDLVEVADYSLEVASNPQSIYYQAKTVVNLDRTLWAGDLGYTVSMHRIPGLDGYPKDDLVIGRLH